jgi:hypothetical protein
MQRGERVYLTQPASPQEIKEKIEPEAHALLAEMARQEARGEISESDRDRALRALGGALIQNARSEYEQDLAKAKQELGAPGQQQTNAVPSAASFEDRFKALNTQAFGQSEMQRGERVYIKQPASKQDLKDKIEPQAHALLMEMARVEARGGMTEAERERVFTAIGGALIPNARAEYQQDLLKAKQELAAPGQQQGNAAPVVTTSPVAINTGTERRLKDLSPEEMARMLVQVATASFSSLIQPTDPSTPNGPLVLTGVKTSTTRQV